MKRAIRRQHTLHLKKLAYNYFSKEIERDLKNKFLYVGSWRGRGHSILSYTPDDLNRRLRHLIRNDSRDIRNEHRRNYWCGWRRCRCSWCMSGVFNQENKLAAKLQYDIYDDLDFEQELIYESKGLNTDDNYYDWLDEHWGLI